MDNNGYIDLDELSSIMSKLGQNLNVEQLRVNNFLPNSGQNTSNGLVCSYKDNIKK